MLLHSDLALDAPWRGDRPPPLLGKAGSRASFFYCSGDIILAFSMMLLEVPSVLYRYRLTGRQQ